MKCKLFEAIGENQFRLAATNENATGTLDPKAFLSFNGAKTEIGHINEILIEIDREGTPPDSMREELRQHSQLAIQHLNSLLQFL